MRDPKAGSNNQNKRSISRVYPDFNKMQQDYEMSAQNKRKRLVKKPAQIIKETALKKAMPYLIGGGSTGIGFGLGGLTDFIF